MLSTNAANRKDQAKKLRQKEALSERTIFQHKEERRKNLSDKDPVTPAETQKISNESCSLTLHGKRQSSNDLHQRKLQKPNPTKEEATSALPPVSRRTSMHNMNLLDVESAEDNYKKATATNTTLHRLTFRQIKEKPLKDFLTGTTPNPLPEEETQTHDSLRRERSFDALTLELGQNAADPIGVEFGLDEKSNDAHEFFFLLASKIQRELSPFFRERRESETQTHQSQLDAIPGEVTAFLQKKGNKELLKQSCTLTAYGKEFTVQPLDLLWLFGKDSHSLIESVDGIVRQELLQPAKSKKDLGITTAVLGSSVNAAALTKHVQQHTKQDDSPQTTVNHSNTIEARRMTFTTKVSRENLLHFTR